MRLLILHGLLPIILVVSYLIFGLVQPQFFSWINLINILRQSSYLIMLATAQMMVLITRGFDLSVGTVIGMISVASALVMAGIVHNSPQAVYLAIFLGCLTGLGIGLAVGTVNGLAIALLRINPFVATLGMLGIGLGFATTLSDGHPVYDVPETFMDILSRASLLGIPVPIIVCAIILVVVYLILNHTLLGRSIYLLGSNIRAADVAGIATKFYLTLAYVICSLIVAIVALMLTARTGSGEPMVGLGLMIDSLMAAIIGGVSLMGGEGRVIHCIVGGLFVTVLDNGMNIMRIDSNIQKIILGVVLIGAIFIDHLRSRIR